MISFLIPLLTGIGSFIAEFWPIILGAVALFGAWFYGRNTAIKDNKIEALKNKDKAQEKIRQAERTILKLEQKKTKDVRDLRNDLKKLNDNDYMDTINRMLDKAFPTGKSGDSK